MSVSSSLTRILALGAFLAATRAVEAQVKPAQHRAVELRISDGGFIPTGEQRNSLKNAETTTAQLSWSVRPSLAVVGSFGWARSRDMSTVNTPKLDVFTSDLGIEGRTTPWFATHAVTFSPFAGLGAGVRSYNYRSLDVDATHNLAAYLSAGGEMGLGRIGVRLEVRDYTSGFKPLMGTGNSGTRNDLVIIAGLRFSRSRAAQNQ